VRALRRAGALAPGPRPHGRHGPWRRSIVATMRQGHVRLLPEAARVLVIETGLMGELLVVTPALRAIKKSRPGAEVTVMAAPGSAPVLISNPHVDRLLPLSKRERAGLIGLVRLAFWIRAQRFDAVFVLHTSFRSALAAFLGGVPLRAGLSCEGRGFLLTHRTPRDRSAYEVDEHLRAVGLLGVPSDGRSLEIHLTDDERSEAAGLLRDVAGRSFAILHPGASRETRRWPAERFAEVGARLVGEPEMEAVYVVGPGERALGERVERWYSRARLDRPVVISPRNVRVLAAVFELASVVVANNTGPMHVAAAVGVPGVFLHGPTPVERWHPPGSRYVPVFAEEVSCRPCDSPRCGEKSLLCMEAIGVDEVFEAVTGLLTSRGDTGSARPESDERTTRH
jgi:lipopolysaccharide heptosyltransferase II